MEARSHANPTAFGNGSNRIGSWSPSAHAGTPGGEEPGQAFRVLSYSSRAMSQPRAIARLGGDSGCPVVTVVVLLSRLRLGRFALLLLRAERLDARTDGVRDRLVSLRTRVLIDHRGARIVVAHARQATRNRRELARRSCSSSFRPVPSGQCGDTQGAGAPLPSGIGASTLELCQVRRNDVPRLSASARWPAHLGRCVGRRAEPVGRGDYRRAFRPDPRRSRCTS